MIKLEATPRRRRRKLKKMPALILIATLLLIYIAFNIPILLDNNALSKLGYTDESIEAIRKYDLVDQVIDEEIYTDFLNSSLPSEEFRLEDLEIYLNREAMSVDEWKLYDILAITYTQEERIQLFDHLQFDEITPLLVFDKVATVQDYINDVVANRSDNANGGFQLDGDYITHYESITSVVNPGTYDMLVNKKYALSSTYVPGNLVEMSVRYAAQDQFMDAAAYSSFMSMHDAMNEAGLNMFASSTYRDYEHQATNYENSVKANGDEADYFVARAGHSEHQTGLAVDLAVEGAGGLGGFGETAEYQWMIENAASFGWILRYPENEKLITGYQNEPWHWRYVGSDLAPKIIQSGLTYDEYALLYLLN